MARSLLLTCALLALLCASACARPVAHTLISWSSQDHDAVPHSGAWLQQSSLSDSTLSELKEMYGDDILVVYLSGEAVSQASLRLLAPTVQANPIVVPYVQSAWDVEAALHAVASADILSVGCGSTLDGVADGSFSSALERISSASSTNNILVVCVPSIGEVAEYEESLKEKSVAHTSVVTSVGASPALQLSFPGNAASRSIRSVRTERKARGVEADEVVYDSEWPPQVLEGLLLGAMLVFVTVIGFWATMNIQTPERFEGGEKRRS